MIVLSMDSSSLVTTVALLKDEHLLGEFTLNFKREHSVILMEKIEMLLKDCNIDISEVDGFVVSKGPGSFTGLRIGMATVKGLSMGSNKPYLSISSLDALAYSLVNFDGIICTQSKFFVNKPEIKPYVRSGSLKFNILRHRGQAHFRARRGRRAAVYLHGAARRARP